MTARRDADRFKNVPVAALAVAAGTTVFFLGQIFSDADTYWHIRTGEWIFGHRAVPLTDPFSWTYVGKPWTAHEWLSELLLTLAYRAAGWSGVAVATGLSVAAAVGILGVYLRRRLSPRIVLPILAFVLLAASQSLLARPHIFALPILLLWTINLLSARQRQRAPPLWSALLMVLWANLHGSFVFGLALVAPFALEAVVASWPKPWPAIRGWGLFGAATALAALANPQGLQGVIYPISLMSMTSLQGINEWRSADFSHFSAFEVVLLEGLFFGFWLGVRVPAIRLIVLLGLFHLALQHGRHQFVFVFVTPLLLAEPVAVALRERGKAVEADRLGFLQTRAVAILVGTALAAAVGLRLALPLPRGDDAISPVSALAAVPADLVRTPVFNDYNFGGYLIFRGVRTFIDGRSDMYGDKYFEKYRAMIVAPPAALAADLDRLGARWTILKADSPAVPTLDRLPGWRRLYADKYAVVHARAAAAAPSLIPRDDR